jgi:hypothetical protein
MSFNVGICVLVVQHLTSLSLASHISDFVLVTLFRKSSLLAYSRWAYESYRSDDLFLLNRLIDTQINKES